MAEFLLRKTQAFRVVPLYAVFMEQYPTVRDLAKADPPHVRHIVAPLGLPERGAELVEIARSLIASGKEIESGYSLLKFAGVGTYIANAVECLAFRRPAPLVDGAVGRLLRRLFALAEGKPAYADKPLWELAQEILQSTSESCRDVSLGLLDISATYCKVRNPACIGCPLEKFCAYKQSHTDSAKRTA
ncbi:MAG: A/G-specific adenine glycosylase [Chloroflexi bacterium]|nr:A/G-specific adenine glycosylase [Chloroflexota bacterium]